MDTQTQGLIYGGGKASDKYLHSLSCFTSYELYIGLISDGPGERLSKHVTFPNWVGSTETGSVHSYIADEDAWQYSLQQYEEIRTAFAPQNLRIDLQVRTPSLMDLLAFSDLTDTAGSKLSKCVAG